MYTREVVNLSCRRALPCPGNVVDVDIRVYVYPVTPVTCLSDSERRCGCRMMTTSMASRAVAKRINDVLELLASTKNVAPSWWGMYAELTVVIKVLTLKH